MSKFVVLGDFGVPSFCPNCGSDNIHKVNVDRKPPFPPDPRRKRPIYFMNDENINDNNI